MSKDPMSKIRAGDTWKRIERVLKDFGVRRDQYFVTDKRPHPVLTVTYFGLTAEMTFAGTPGSRFTCRQVELKLRELLKSLRLQALENDAKAAHAAPRAIVTRINNFFPIKPAEPEPATEPQIMPVATASSISIMGVDMRRIEYKGEQVVTFGMVDKVHARPDGTAGRTFRENRNRFVELEDFVTLDQPDEIRRLGFSRPQGGTPASIILITKRGYLKLVKPLTDDRAWEVQGEMIERYFVVEAMRKDPALSMETLDMIERTNGIVRMLAHKTTVIEGTIAALASTISTLAGTVDSLTGTVKILAETVHRPAPGVLFRQGRSAGEILEAAGINHHLKGLAQWTGNRLEAMGCRVEGNAKAESGLSSARLFDPDKASHWINSGGRLAIEKKIRERGGQGVLALVSGA